jgi:hypothetical protein
MRRRRNQQPRRQQQQQPPPPEPTIGIKDDGPAPEGTHDVRPTLHVPTTPVSHEKVLRGEGEKARGAQPLDGDVSSNLKPHSSTIRSTRRRYRGPIRYAVVLWPLRTQAAAVQNLEL